MKNKIKRMKKILAKFGEDSREISFIDGELTVIFASPSEWDGDIVVAHTWGWAIAPKDPARWESWVKIMLEEEKLCFFPI